MLSSYRPAYALRVAAAQPLAISAGAPLFGGGGASVAEQPCIHPHLRSSPAYAYTPIRACACVLVHAHSKTHSLRADSGSAAQLAAQARRACRLSARCAPRCDLRAAAQRSGTAARDGDGGPSGRVAPRRVACRAHRTPIEPDLRRRNPRGGRTRPATSFTPRSLWPSAPAALCVRDPFPALWSLAPTAPPRQW
eukprot:gene12973-biopygen71